MYYSKFDRDHFLLVIFCNENIPFLDTICTPYIDDYLKLKLLQNFVLMNVHTSHTLQLNSCTPKILHNTAFQPKNQNCHFSFSKRKKDFIWFVNPKNASETVKKPS